MNMNSSILNSFKKISKAAQIITIHNYRPNTVPGKIADYQIIINVDYEKAITRSLKIIKAYQIGKVDCGNLPFSPRDLSLARDELVFSIEKSLKEKNWERYPYTFLNDVKCLKLDNNTDIIHLYGFFLQERVYQVGLKKEVKSAPKTLAKKYISRLLPHDRYVQFRLTKENCERISVNRLKLKM